MHTTDEEVSLVVEGLRHSTNMTPVPNGDDVPVPEFVPTRYEIMIILQHYLERSYGAQIRESDARDDDAERDADPCAWRAANTLALLELLFGSGDLERLETHYLAPIHKKWKECGRG